MYDALAGLPNPFDIFYSVAWQSRDLRSVRDGEADFVITHPELGLLVIEVKGGAIHYDGLSGKWHSGSNEIKDPVVQATNNHYELIRKLESLPDWPTGWITSGHAVAFPKIQVEDVSLRLDLPREIILDHSSLENMEGDIRSIFRYYAGTSGRPAVPGRDRCEQIRKLFARSFHIQALPDAGLRLGAAIKDEIRQIITLTEQQMKMLDLLSTRRRAAIQGCAGSGKTMLALEKANRLAGEGFKVLLTCFNAALANHLANLTHEEVTVLNFHAFCREVIQEGGFVIQTVRDKEHYDNVVLPEMALQALDQTGPKYDAIIVDEGQDFKENWWLPLLSALRDQEDGILFVFYDDNQNLYNRSEEIAQLVPEAPFPLFENCRNTKKIHGLVSLFHQNGARLRCPGPVGRKPEILEYVDTRDLQRQLGQVLHRLVIDEKVDTDDIAILTPRSQDRSELKAGIRVGNFTLAGSTSSKSNYQVQVSTVHKFKGLERPVIILAELDNAMFYTPDEIIYVGSSRAQNHLVVLYDHAWNAVQKGKILAYAA